jgi:hypothetical protein
MAIYYSHDVLWNSRDYPAVSSENHSERGPGRIVGAGLRDAEDGWVWVAVEGSEAEAEADLGVGSREGGKSHSTRRPHRRACFLLTVGARGQSSVGRLSRIDNLQTQGPPSLYGSSWSPNPISDQPRA